MSDSESVRAGDVHVFKPGQSLAIGIGVWAAKQGGRIHIHLTGPLDMHTTVTNHEGSERYHRTLFRDLRRILVEHDAWPYGDEGSETEK